MTPQITQNEQPQTLGAASFYLPPFKFSQTKEPLQQLEEAYSFLDYYIEINKPEMIARFQRDVRALEEMLLPNTPTGTLLNMSVEDYNEWHEVDIIPEEEKEKAGESNIQPLINISLPSLNNSRTNYTDEELTPFQQEREAKRHFYSLIADEKNILLDFFVETPRKGFKKKHKTLNNEVAHSLFSSKKESLPEIKASNSQTYDFALADIDFVPSFCRGGFDTLRQVLISYFKEKTGVIVSGSYSSKVKVWFFFENKLSIEKKKQYLKQQFSSCLNLWNETVEIEGKKKYVIDRDGIEHSFITLEMLEELRMGIQKNGLISGPKNKQEVKSPAPSSSTNISLPSLNNSRTNSTPYHWNSSKEAIPENMLNNLKTKIPLKHLARAIQYAMGSTSCLTNGGVAIPQDLLARELGVSQRYASSVLKECMLLGIMIKTSRYIAHVLACKYKLIGFWASWAARILKNNKKTAGTKTREDILEKFKDGNWNKPTLEFIRWHVNRGSSLQDTLKDFKSVIGWDLKQRAYRAEQAYIIWNECIYNNNKQLELIA